MGHGIAISIAQQSGEAHPIGILVEGAAESMESFNATALVLLGHLPGCVRVEAIEQVAVAAHSRDINQAQLIVGFAGLDEIKVDALRSEGISAPAVNLCQFVLSLDTVNPSAATPIPDVRDVIVGAALQFGFGGGSALCQICADKVGESIDYWINIADTCSRFAQTVQRLQR